jgi:hypothetical protein
MRSIFIGIIVAVVAGGYAASAGQEQKSVATLLNLSGSQLVQLEQLYDYLHAIRYQEEQKANRDLAASERRVRAAFVSAQREAKSLLSPGQFYLLENRLEDVRLAPQAQHRLVLVDTFEEFMAMPLDIEAARRWLDAQVHYRRDRTWLGFGLGFCGHHHWCHPKRPRCGNPDITGINGSRRTSIPGPSGNTGSRGGGSVIGGRGGKR